MTSRITSLQRPTPSTRRGYQYRDSGRRPTSFRPCDHGVEARQPLSLPLLAASGQAARILLVDDIDTTAPLVFLLHGLAYCTTRAASCAETALHLAQDFSPSIVLLTLQLPEMGAYRLAARLRDQAAGREFRLIALTDDYAHADRDLARQAGFEQYLLKPVSISALQRLLRPIQP